MTITINAIYNRVSMFIYNQYPL